MSQKNMNGIRKVNASKNGDRERGEKGQNRECMKENREHHQ